MFVIQTSCILSTYIKITYKNSLPSDTLSKIKDENCVKNDSVSRGSDLVNFGGSFCLLSMLGSLLMV